MTVYLFLRLGLPFLVGGAIAWPASWLFGRWWGGRGGDPIEAALIAATASYAFYGACVGVALFIFGMQP